MTIGLGDRGAGIMVIESVRGKPRKTKKNSLRHLLKGKEKPPLINARKEILSRRGRSDTSIKSLVLSRTETGGEREKFREESAV